MVAHRETAETNKEDLAELMVGRKVILQIDKDTAKPGKSILKVEKINFVDDSNIQRVKNVNFEVQSGEILGIAGVSGNGQSELMDLITGIRPLQDGRIQINENIITNDMNADAAVMRKLGIGHVPEDRQRRGLVTEFSANENVILGYHKDPTYNHFLEMDKVAIVKSCENNMKNFDVRPDNPFLKTSLFSGGNQQKLVVAREIARDPKLLVVGQPTRGVDIGAIEFIHKQIIGMRDAGKAVLLVSVELDEILSLSDRILVMFEGQIMGEVLANQASERKIGLLMAGIKEEV